MQPPNSQKPPPLDDTELWVRLNAIKEVQTKFRSLAVVCPTGMTVEEVQAIQENVKTNLHIAFVRFRSAIMRNGFNAPDMNWCEYVREHLSNCLLSVSCWNKPDRPLYVHAIIWSTPLNLNAVDRGRPKECWRIYDAEKGLWLHESAARLFAPELAFQADRNPALLFCCN